MNTFRIELLSSWIGYVGERKELNLPGRLYLFNSQVFGDNIYHTQGRIGFLE